MPTSRSLSELFVEMMIEDLGYIKTMALLERFTTAARSKGSRSAYESLRRMRQYAKEKGEVENATSAQKDSAAKAKGTKASKIGPAKD